MDEPAQYPNPSSSLSALDDQRVREDIVRALEATGHLAVYRVDVSTSDGVVRLHGRVPSFYYKQLAQAAASSKLGNRQLINEIQVT